MASVKDARDSRRICHWPDRTTAEVYILNVFLSLVNLKDQAIKKQSGAKDNSIHYSRAVFCVNRARTESRVSNTREPPDWANAYKSSLCFAK